MLLLEENRLSRSRLQQGSHRITCPQQLFCTIARLINLTTFNLMKGTVLIFQASGMTIETFIVAMTKEGKSADSKLINFVTLD